MSGWIKGLMLPLSAVIAVGLLSATAASATAASATDTATPGAMTVHAEPTGTFAEQVAKKAFRKVAAAHAKEMRTARRIAERSGRKPVVPGITDVRRWRALPDSMVAPMQGLASSRPDNRDDDGQVTFFTGVNETAACLTMRTGAIARGLCGVTYRPVPATLTMTYDTLILSIQWFDAHSTIYDATTRSATLVSSLIRTETPEGTEAQIVDSNADGVIDDGTLVLITGRSCGTVLLPDHDPNGATYRAELRHEQCETAALSL